jgi:hypothetical protein
VERLPMADQRPKGHFGFVERGGRLLHVAGGSAKVHGGVHLSLLGEVGHRLGMHVRFQNGKGTITGTGTMPGQGDDGQGPVTPIIGGKIANNEITMKWTGPPGGY